MAKNNKNASTTTIPLLLTLFTFISISSSSSPDTFLYVGCSQPKYTQDSPYESNLNSLVTLLVNSATYSSYNKYSVLDGPAPQDAIYGVYQCRGDLSMPDCATCIARAATRVVELCPGTCGGAIQLDGCFVKYDNVSFLGVEDKTVVMKKCGPSNGVDNGLMATRDAVLGGLGSGGGPYRVGGSEGVRGIAQCVGDLSSGQCQDCLAEAVRKLRSECGGGVFGDMFLGKCYARYTTDGVDGYSSRSNDNHGSSHSESEKTFAIIIGLLAGVALVIIFLTFVSRMFGRHGK